MLSGNANCGAQSLKTRSHAVQSSQRSIFYHDNSVGDKEHGHSIRLSIIRLDKREDISSELSVFRR